LTFIVISDTVNLTIKLSRSIEMTIGTDRVRVSFNPSADSVVDQIKQKTADLIDLCETLKPLDVRLASLAQTNYEDAAMWAVKAATTGK
jgi:hypothetical protein